MKKSLLLAAVALAAGSAAVAGVLVWRARHPPHPPPPTVNVHGQGIDREMTSLRAMYDAPAGATPCESAYNAFKAGRDAAVMAGKTQLVVRLAPRDQFVAGCGKLPAEAQACLIPVYSAHHRPECEKLKPAPELLAPLFELKPLDGAK